MIPHPVFIFHSRHKLVNNISLKKKKKTVCLYMIMESALDRSYSQKPSLIFQQNKGFQIWKLVSLKLPSTKPIALTTVRNQH